MTYFDNSNRFQKSHHHQTSFPRQNQSYLMYNSINNRFQSQVSQTQNDYYNVKQKDNHRFDKIMLQKPAFLIKDQFLYPSNFNVSDKLEYADRLIQDTKSKHYYRDDAEEYRMRKIGLNPFNKSVLEIGQKIKKRVTTVNSQYRQDAFNPEISNSNDDLAVQILKFQRNLHRQNNNLPIARKPYILGLKPKQEQIIAQQKYQKQQEITRQKQIKQSKQKNYIYNEQQQFDNPFERDSDQDSDFATRKQKGYFSPIAEEQNSDHYGQKMGQNILSFANQQRNNNSRYQLNKSSKVQQRSSYEKGPYPIQISYKGKLFKRIL